MARQIMVKAQNESLRAYLRGKRSFKLFGITLTIQHAHDNEYQVLLPDLRLRPVLPVGRVLPRPPAPMPLSGVEPR